MGRKNDPSYLVVARIALAIWIVFPLAGATPASFNRLDSLASLGEK